MEANKIDPRYEAKSIAVANGAELTYCELGTDNEEVLISGAFYFHTFMPVLEGLAKRYHVYGVVMRGKGPVTQKLPDGRINWDRQWGEDVYQFAQALGIDKFHYVGKCHGVNPGWFMVREHPEMIETLCSLYMAPHVREQNSNVWMETLEAGDQQKLLSLAMRDPAGVAKKAAEVKALGPEGMLSLPPATGEQASSPELVWDGDKEATRKALESCPVPVLYLFGTDDLVFRDHYDSTIEAVMITKRAKTVFLQGERHLMEMDCPERMAEECLFFIEESRKGY
ncbi:MAG: alpha/beta hydrolase [Coriobacteriales bacterium]|jgi:pimeloyl-ACP methyl ester carboxylesterase